MSRHTAFVRPLKCGVFGLKALFILYVRKASIIISTNTLKNPEAAPSN